jgi:hypothetical protein
VVFRAKQILAYITLNMIRALILLGWELLSSLPSSSEQKKHNIHEGYAMCMYISLVTLCWYQENTATMHGRIDKVEAAYLRTDNMEVGEV